MTARMMSLAVTPGRRVPSTLMAMVLNGFRDSVWVAMTCSTSDGADAHREGAEGAVGGGVRVAADHGHAGLGEAQLRADHVDDALLGVAEGVQPDTELLAVVAQGLDLRAAGEIGNWLVDVQRGSVVVLGGDGEVRPAQRASGQPEALKGLRRRHLVHQVEVDEEKVGLGVGSFAVALCAPRARPRLSRPVSLPRPAPFTAVYVLASLLSPLNQHSRVIRQRADLHLR